MEQNKGKDSFSYNDTTWCDRVIDSLPMMFKQTIWVPWFVMVIVWLSTAKCIWVVAQSPRHIGTIFRCRIDATTLGKDWFSVTYDTSPYDNYGMQRQTPIEDIEKKLKQDFYGKEVKRKPKVYEVTLEEIPFDR